MDRTSKHTAARLLGVLELLQARGRLSGSDIAGRLGVDRRTVRRYVAVLEEMGIPVTAERGRAGGYELVAGFRLPPMMFTNDEALALGLGLAAVRGHDVPGPAGALDRATLKLERVLPPGVRANLRSAVEAVDFGRPPRAAATNGAAFAALCAAAYERRSVRLRYRPVSGDESERDFDPYGLAFREGTWYVAGWCHLRRELRTFRLDRVVDVSARTRTFERPDGFDAFQHLARSIATLPRRFGIEILLHTDLDSASRALFPELGVLEPRGRAVLLRSQADDLPWFARELSRLPCPFEVLRPRSLARALERHARALLDAGTRFAGVSARARGAGTRPRRGGRAASRAAGPRPPTSSETSRSA